MPRFHHAFAIAEIARSHEFYAGRPGCSVGRGCDHWIDFELFGHQLSALRRPARRAGDDVFFDPDGHALEFKAYVRADVVFAR